MITYMTQINLVKVIWNSTHAHTMLLVQMQFDITIDVLVKALCCNASKQHGVTRLTIMSLITIQGKH